MLSQTAPARSGSQAGRTAAAGATAKGGSTIGATAAAPAVRTSAGGDFSDIVELSRRRPVPKLLLPIVGPSYTPRPLPPPASPRRPSHDTVGAPVREAGLGRSASTNTPPAAFERSVATGPARESLAMDVFGFALAWVMTTAAGSLVFGHVMARSQPPLVVQVPDVAHTANTSEPQASCPKSSWEPPLVAVADLPTVAQPHVWSQHALASNDLPPAPIARPLRQTQDTVRRSPSPAKGWTAAAVRHGRFVGTQVPSAGKAKASPKTLEEWMRASVDSG